MWRMDICTCCPRNVAKPSACKFVLQCRSLVTCCDMCCETRVLVLPCCFWLFVIVCNKFLSRSMYVVNQSHFLWCLQIKWKWSQQGDQFTVRSERSVQPWYQQHSSGPTANVYHGCHPCSPPGNPFWRAERAQRGASASPPDICAHHTLTRKARNVRRATHRFAARLAVVYCVRLVLCFVQIFLLFQM